MIKDFTFRAGSYVPDRDAYLTIIYYKDDCLCDVYFYDEPEDIDKPMDIDFYENQTSVPLEDFLKAIQRAKDEFNEIRKEKGIKKKLF